MLEAMFETVVMVADKASLFDIAEKINPDLAVVDLSLPVSGEINIARQLKDKYPKLKIIILSVHDEQTVVSETMNSGISGFVLKRSVASDLFPAVDKVLGGKTFVSPLLEYEF